MFDKDLFFFYILGIWLETVLVILVSFIIYSYVYLQLNAESDGDTDVNSVCVSDSVPSF